MKRALLFVAAAWAGILGGCTVGDPDGGYRPEMTFEEFEALTYKEPWEGGAYIVNGDTPIVDRKHLYEFWYELFQPDGPNALIVNRYGGADDRWSDTRKLNLTYCISNNFGSYKTTIINAFNSAAAGWESRANVNFVYVSSQDSSCTNGNNNVLFNVRMVTGQPYLASAFFPSYGRASREVKVDSSSFGNTGWPLSNIIAHELGHVLGFRHEHTRPEAGTCYEDSNWRALTPYDRASIMHYPQCNGSSSNLAFTTVDGQGAAALYGVPGGQPPPPPPGVDRQQSWSGSLARGQFVVLSPTLSVVPGSSLTVQMTGSGDADLYVRFGAAPTRSSWNCRPYLSSSSETCSLTVPSTATTAYVGVDGYTASTYSITASYRAPN
jgi:serine protease